MNNGQAIKPMSMINMVTGAAFSGGPAPVPEPPPPGPDPAQVAEQQMKAERSQLQNQKLKDEAWVRRLEQLEKRQGKPSSRMDSAMKGLDLIKGTAQKLQIKRATANSPVLPEPTIAPYTGSYVAPKSSVQPTSKWQLAKDMGKDLFGRPMVESAKNFMADPNAGVQPLLEATVGAPGSWRDAGNDIWNKSDQAAKQYEPGSIGSGFHHTYGAMMGNAAKIPALARQSVGNWLAHGLVAPAATAAKGAWNTASAVGEGGMATIENLATNGLNSKITPQMADAGHNLWGGARDLLGGGASLAMNFGPGKLFKGLGFLQDGVANTWGAPAPTPPQPAAPPEGGGGIMEALGPMLASITSSLGSITGDAQTALSNYFGGPSQQGPLNTSNNRLIYG